MERKPTYIRRRAGMFLRREDGAVTVDWVVLTGFIVALGMATAFFVAAGVPVLADKVGTGVSSMPVTGN